jgi:hypothetical protein
VGELLVAMVFYQISIQTNNKGLIVDTIEKWLSKEGKSFTNQFYKKINQNVIDSFEEERITKFGVSKFDEKWVIVMHNGYSYDHLIDLSNFFSKDLDGYVINTIGHSTSNEMFLSVHQTGKLIRKIHYGDDTDGTNLEGCPLPFEKDIPAPVIDGEELPKFDLFDDSDLVDYCCQLGLDIGKDDPFYLLSDWDVLEILEQKNEEKPSLLSKIRGIFR